MSGCNQCDDNPVRYLNGELQAQELEDFRSHLEICESCRVQLESEQNLSQLLHRSRPLYSAPAALRASISAAIDQHSAPSHIIERLGGRIQQLLGRTLPDAARRFPRLRVLAPAGLAVALCLALVPNIARQVRAASFVETAVATHRAFVAGNLVPGIHSNSPNLVSAWFIGKVPFDFRLPTAGSAPENKSAYRLTGADLVNFKGSPAALITYEAPGDKISLLVASSKSAVVAGGDEVQFGSLTFHYQTNANFKVITWSNHGLSYALVSSVSGSARGSCMVCHQDMADHDSFRTHP